MLARFYFLRVSSSVSCLLSRREVGPGRQVDPVQGSPAAVYIIPLRVNQKNICEHAKNLLTMLVLFGIIYIENERK